MENSKGNDMVEDHSTKLDLTALNTVEDLDAVKWSDYFGSEHNNGINGWVKSIKYPVKQDDLNRICELSQRSNKIRLSWNMGELFVRQGFIQMSLILDDTKSTKKGG